MANIRYNFNMPKLPDNRGTQQDQARRAANKLMIPDGGDLLLVWDRHTVSWFAQYRDCYLRQVGWLGQGRTALEAIKSLESLNYPHPAENDSDLLSGTPS